MFNSIGNPLEALDIISQLNPHLHDKDIKHMFPDHILDTLSLAIIKSISILVARNTDIHALRYQPLHPNLSLLINSLFDIDLPSPFVHTNQSSYVSNSNDALPPSPHAFPIHSLSLYDHQFDTRTMPDVLDNTYKIQPLILNDQLLVALTQSFKTSLELKISGFENTSSSSIARLNHSYIEILETLKKLRHVNENLSTLDATLDQEASSNNSYQLNERIKKLCEKDLGQFFDALVTDTTLTQTLIQMDLSKVKKENLNYLASVYLFAIENCKDEVDVRLRERASECLLKSMNTSDVGLSMILDLLKNKLSEEGIFEMLVVLQSHPFVKLIILES